MESGSSVDSILGRLSLALGAAEVPYMLTGSFASSLHGAPRVTHDIDIVIAPTLGSLNKLCDPDLRDRFSHTTIRIRRESRLRI